VPATAYGEAVDINLRRIHGHGTGWRLSISGKRRASSIDRPLSLPEQQMQLPLRVLSGPWPARRGPRGGSGGVHRRDPATGNLAPSVGPANTLELLADPRQACGGMVALSWIRVCCVLGVGWRCRDGFWRCIPPVWSSASISRATSSLSGVPLAPRSRCPSLIGMPPPCTRSWNGWTRGGRRATPAPRAGPC
jgi:hypothetical protein